MKRSSVRLRLTALYSGLFMATAVVLVVAMNTLLAENLQRQAAGISGVPGALAEPLTPVVGPYPPPRAAPPGAEAQLTRFSEGVLRHQWLVSGITVGGLAFLSIGVGWWLTGRALRPLHRITETARRLSMSNLHERIGPVGTGDELSDLADTFDTMLARLEVAVDNQRRFIANAAHELRTP